MASHGQQERWPFVLAGTVNRFSIIGRYFVQLLGVMESGASQPELHQDMLSLLAEVTLWGLGGACGWRAFF